MKIIPKSYVCKEDRFKFDLKKKKITKVQISKEDIMFVEKFSELWENYII